MKINISTQRFHGLTFIEVVVVIVFAIVLAAILIPARHGGPVRSRRIYCVNNLKQIGTAYRVWENDNGGLYPTMDRVVNGGMQDFLTNSISAGRYAYLPYAIMQNELGQSPKVVVCSSDERKANTDFYWGPKNAPSKTSTNWPAVYASGTFDNTNVSYFVGVGAADACPQSILAGDRNLGDGGVINVSTGEVSKPEQDPYYGISGTTANPEYPCGADVVINTNGRWASAFISGGEGHVGVGSQAVGWSAKMHSAGNIAGAGNILLGDGSAQQCTSASLRINWLRNATNLGNFGAVDTRFSAADGSIRLLIP